jgi:hypothetical protein
MATSARLPKPEMMKATGQLRSPGSVWSEPSGGSSWRMTASITIAAAKAGQRHAPSSRQRRRRVQKRSSAATSRG